MRYALIVFVLIVCCFSFSCRKDSLPYITLAGKAQGTTFQITYKDSLHRNFSDQVDSLFRLIDHSMSLWDSQSLIRRINRNDSLVEVDEHFRNVFNRSMEIAHRTDGAFDATVGQLIQTWKSSLKDSTGKPDSSMIKHLLDITGYQKISLPHNQVLKSNPEIQLDFNGIAQGYTVDLIASHLQNHGIHDYLVEIGGEVRAGGLNDRGTLWQVGIDKPTETMENGRPLLTSIALDNKALATSGSYRNFIQKDGKKYNHIINPKTGYPVEHDVVSVSVIAEDCMTADALATAYMVMGMEQALISAGRDQVEIYCIYKDGNGNLQVKATAGFSMQ